MKILIACGGSGGHIFPGIALAEALADLKKDARIFIATSDRYIDTEIFKEERFRHFLLPYNPLPESLNPVRIFKFFVKLTESMVKAAGIVKKCNPDCVVGLGGYVSGPIIFAAWLIHRHILVHEQNVLPSLTNKLSAVFADKVCVTFDETRSHFKGRPTVKTGNPIRRRFLTERTESAYESLGIDKEKFTVLVMGGSQGSRALNDSFKKAIGDMDKGQRAKLGVLHIAGRIGSPGIKEAYENAGVAARVYPFLEKMGYAYSAADLIVSRAGATALSEISMFGKPSILIPYPKKRVHQKENAEFFSARGASICIEEKDLSPNRLRDAVLNLMGDPVRLRNMASRAKSLSNSDAAYKLAKETVSTCYPLKQKFILSE